MMHDAEMINVSAPNIAKETDEWRCSFDTIDAYINAYCVRNENAEVLLSDMVNSYIIWHDKTYAPVVHDRFMIAEAFHVSKLGDFIKQRNNVNWVVGVRFVADITEQLGADEKRFMRSDEFDFKDYRDYKMPDGLKMPFHGKINPTADARTFLRELKALHQSELKAYRERPAEPGSDFEIINAADARPSPAVAIAQDIPTVAPSIPAQTMVPTVA
jgi:hypothetical protein